MSTVLVYIEFASGKIKSGSLELLTAARAHGEVTALALGTGASALLDECKKYGVKTLFVNEDAVFTHYNPMAQTDLVAQLVDSKKPTRVLSSGSALTRDLMPRVAARLSLPYAADCVELDLASPALTSRKPYYSGKVSASIQMATGSTQVLVMRPNQLKASETTPTDTKLETAPYQAKDLLLTVKEVVRGASAKLDLSEANIIVSGGRGMKGPEHFSLLNEMADVLGATVGASRAVVDAGWVSHSMQVGQTGKTVAPTLYIACGISGAIQHLAGMSSSKVIVAINKDPEAPIFKKATYGIVGDVFEVLPLLTAEFRKLLS